MLTFQQIKASFPVIQSEIQHMGFPAALKYLRDRGIPEELIDDLGIQILPASEIFSRTRGKVSNDDRLAIVIPHFNIAGDYIDWWSARLVDTGLRPVVHSFANLAPHKRGKMTCPPNESPHGYLPPTLDWRRLGRGDRVYIHESAIKAINGARLGAYSIGLNGVWGWSSKKHGVVLVPELRDLPWRALELNPVIVFDSNAEDNWDVQAAISGLAAKLYEITGRKARHILLPRSPEGEHWGFDDYVARVGPEAGRAYLQWEGYEVSLDEVQALKIKLNSEVCVVRSLGKIADQETGTLMTRGVFIDVNYAHYLAPLDDKMVSVPRLWLQDPSRASVEELTYEPGHDRIVADKLNFWRGMGLEPSKGSVQMWLQLLEKNIPDPELRRWVIQWMAYPLQNLGAKMTTFLHLYGPPGSGKQAILKPLMRVYGERNAIVIGKEQVSSSFNSIYTGKQFINLDELHAGADNDKVINKLKMLVTGESVVVNTKGVPEYLIPNRANIVSTSNYPDSLRLDDDDRRACVIQFGKRGDGMGAEFWVSYHRWVDEEGGAAAVYAYLLEVDCSTFSPTGTAPVTEAKAEVTRSTRKVDEQWVNDLWDNPDDILPPVLDGRCLFTNGELAQYAYGEDPTGVTPGKKNALGIKMHTAGFQKLELKVDGQKARFWIVRKREYEWTVDAARAHLRLFKYPGA